MGYSIEEIFKSIEYYDDNFQEDKIRLLIDREKESREFLVKYINEFQKNIFKHLNEESYVGHIYAVILLAKFKEKSLCPIFLDILDLPGTRVFELFDTVIPEYGARIIASVYDGNVDNILKLLNDKKANEYAKAVLIQAFKILCLNGDMAKSEVEDFYLDLLNGELKDKKQAVLLEILYAAFELKMENVLETLKSKCKKGQFPSLSISEIEAEIKLYNDGLYENKGVEDVHNQEITNVFEDLRNIFKAIDEKSQVKKEAEKLQDTIIREINILGKKFQRGVRSSDLGTNLRSLAKEDLYDIGKHIGLKGYYKLKKSDLIDGILNNYENLIPKKLMCFDEERIQQLKLFLKNDGIVKIDKSNQFNTFFYLESYGLIYPFAEDESTAFIMPDIVKEIIRDIMPGFTFRKCIKKNSEIVSLIKGMMEAYGIMDESDVIDNLKMYGINEFDNYIKDVIEEGIGLYYSMADKTCLVNINVDNFAVVDEIEENITSDDYKLFSKDDIIALGKDDWSESVDFAEEFYNRFAEEFIIERENLLEVMNDMKADIQLVESEVIVQFMVDSIDSKCRDEVDVDELKESKKIVRDLVSNFLENVPLWKLKGRCIKEIKKK